VLDKLQHLVSPRVFKRSEEVVPRIFKLEIINGRVTAYIRGSREPEIHTASIDQNGNYFCSCQGFLSHCKICSHLFAILRKLDEDGVDITPYVKGLLGFGDEKMEVVKTSLEGYNRLFGGLHKGRINAIYGKPEMGKSILDMQFAIDTMEAEGGNSLLIDTEGGIEVGWLKYFLKRNPNLSIERIVWPVEEIVKERGGAIEKRLLFNYGDVEYKKTKKNTIYIWECRTLLPILAFHGRPLYFKESGGVIEPIDEVSHLTSISDSPIGKLVKDCEIKYIGYDSISLPVESEFTGGQSNWRTRAKAEFVLLNRTQQLLDKFNLIAMLVIHATQGGFSKPIPVGGKALLHNAKFVVYISSITKRSGKWAGSKSLRKLEIYRHQFKEAWSESAEVAITDNGFIDLN